MRLRLDVQFAFECSRAGRFGHLTRAQTRRERLSHRATHGGEHILPGSKDRSRNSCLNRIDLRGQPSGKDQWQMAGALARAKRHTKLAPVGGQTVQVNDDRIRIELAKVANGPARICERLGNDLIARAPQFRRTTLGVCLIPADQS